MYRPADMGRSPNRKTGFGERDASASRYLVLARSAGGEAWGVKRSKIECEKRSETHPARVSVGALRSASCTLRWLYRQIRVRRDSDAPQRKGIVEIPHGPLVALALADMRLTVGTRERGVSFSLVFQDGIKET